MFSPRVIVTGSLGFDYIMNFGGRLVDRIMPDKIHQLSLSFLVDKLSKQFGGTAGNIAYTLKLLGADPLIVAPAGNDFDPYLKFLKKNHIRAEGISIDKKETSGIYFVVTDQDDNQIGAYYKGALKFAPRLSLESHLKSSQLVMIAPTESRAMIKYANECAENKTPYIFDPAFQIGDFSSKELAKAIQGAAILIGNDYEISLIERKLNISHLKLIKNSKILITTLGAKGSLIETSKEKIIIKSAKPKSITDPTGAGDAYRAGFIAGYLRHFDLKTCGQMGAVAAVYTVELYGTVTHKFTIKDFQKRYLENFKQEIIL